MRQVIPILFLLLLSLAASAQKSYLERLNPSDTTSIFILRTPPAVIKALIESPDKLLKKKGECMESIERQLESARQGYLVNRLPYIHIQSFLNCVKFLETNEVQVSYYTREYFVYYPKRNSR